MTVTSVILVHDSSSLQHVLAVAHVDLLQTDERAGGQSSEEPVQGAPTLREQQFFQQFHRFICDLSLLAKPKACLSRLTHQSIQFFQNPRNFSLI